MDDRDLRDAGLDLVAARLRAEGVPFAPVVSCVRTVIGSCGQAGSRKPVPSSAAQITIGDSKEWIPAPMVPGDPGRGEAPIYLVSGADYVLPTIRLFGEGGDPAYLGLSDWLLDAFVVWKLPAGQDKHATVLDLLKAWGPDLEADRLIRVVAEVVRLALIGSRGSDRWNSVLRPGKAGAESAAGSSPPLRGLRVPTSPRGRLPSWLRRIGGETELAHATARRLVLTAAMSKAGRPGITGKARHRINPCSEHDRGIDPVHTPEDKESIRLIGYLGTSVSVADRRLVCPQAQRVSLSPSTAQVPFAGHDAPRRLLIAANMQVQAIRVSAEHVPLIRAGDHPVPPGVNLRVGYLAWRGLNHEDAWVLSESAAGKLGTVKTQVQTVFVSAVEAVPDILVSEGDQVEKGEPLLRRTVSPLLLAPDMSAIVDLGLPEPRLEWLERLDLEPDRQVQSKYRGRVARIEVWDLAIGTGLPPDCFVPPAVRGRWRQVLRFHVSRDLPLTEGDKLANRHGHKGVVGRILPDAEMPCWRGRPLEALIDPVSVLNRSNWGQVYETLLGGLRSEASPSSPGLEASREELVAAFRELGGDDAGRGEVVPPDGAGWMSRSCRAVVGVQYVMRLPKHASEILFADLPRRHPPGGTRHGRARLGEQGTWASWAHRIGLGPRGDGAPFADAPDLLALLETAGIGAQADPQTGLLRVCWLNLEEPPSDDLGDPIEVGQTTEETLERMEHLPVGKRAILVLEKPVHDVRLPGLGGSASREQNPASNPGRTVTVRWIRIPPREARRSETGADGAEYEHELTRLLKEVVRRAVYRTRGRPHRGKASPEVLEATLRIALQRLMASAYRHALGAGHKGHKEALLGKRVLRPRLARSGWAVAVPAGLRDDRRMELDLDEVGLPVAIARAVFGRTGISTDEDLLRVSGLERPWVWVKRDPVLHRWGLLRMKARVIPGNGVRLPASVLGPMGADFDGDAVSVFRFIPGEQESAEPVPPSGMAWDEVLDRPVFVPGKQYVYGLHLLGQDGDRRDRLDADLRAAGAPCWPAEPAVWESLSKWSRSAAASASARGEWWSSVERHALLALSADPGMGLGLVDAGDLDRLEPVQAGAAKRELFDNLGPASELRAAYAGSSLAVFEKQSIDATSCLVEDTIATVMVSAAADTGKFGNLPRKFLYAARRLDAEFVRAVHCLSEQANQRVLSVKAGKRPLHYRSFKRQVLDLLLKGRLPDFEALSGDLGDLFASDRMRAACQRIVEGIDQDPPLWSQWLVRPTSLAKLLAKAGGCIDLRLDDPRLGPFFGRRAGE